MENRKDPSENPARPDSRVAEKMAFVDAGLGLAGHEITDPYLRQLLERQSQGEISAEETIRLAGGYISAIPGTSR